MSSGMQIVSVREQPSMADVIIAYFQAHWASEESRMVYEDCIRSSLASDSALPEWYVMLDGERIVGCVGLITNDFISRMDLTPWLCALYVEPDCRGHALGSELIARCRVDAAVKGFDYLYLCTDHIGYYEKYGFEYIADGYHPWGESSRIYRVKT